MRALARLALVVSFAAAATGSEARDGRPNVLVIVADDLGYTDLGFMGGEIRTPHLDALARSGLLLTNFLVSPACSPTRAMLLTGVDTHPAGLGTMKGAADTNQKGHPSYEGELSDRVLPITTLLRAAGYHTYVAGKWHLGKDEAQLPPHKGFERSFVLLPGAASHFADAAGATETSDPAEYREDGREVALPASFYSTAYYTDKLIGQIRSGLADGRPFFAYAAYTSPHWPLQVPDAELDRYRGAYDEGYDTLRGRRFEAARRLGVVPADARIPERTPFARPWEALSPDDKRREARLMELYAAMVENLDHHVGRLLEFLKQSGHYDDTLILFFSDNGAEGNPIDRLATNTEWLGRRFDNGLATSAASTRTPGPARAGPRRRRRSACGRPSPPRAACACRRSCAMAHADVAAASISVVSIKDVAPTVLALAGMKHPGTSSEGRPIASLEGRSMLPLVTGTAQAVHGPDFTMGWELFGRRALRMGRHKILWLSSPTGPSAGSSTTSWPIRWSRRTSRPRSPRGSRARAGVGRLRRAGRRDPADARHGLRARDSARARVARQLRDRRRPALLTARPDQPRQRRRLEPAWVYRTGDMTERAGFSTIQCTPIVVDGVMYLTTPGLKLVALEAASGRKLWEFDPFPGERARGTNRGVTYWKHGRERRIFLGGRPLPHALDPVTGTLVRSFGKDGRVDLREGLDRDVFSLSVIATSPASSSRTC